jgi:methanogenic corrinoid protein MtbC1
MKTLPELGYDLQRALLPLDRLTALRILSKSRSDYTPMQLAELLVVPSLQRIGEAWEQGRLALSQVYMSGRICEEIIDTLLPPASPERQDRPKIAVATLEDYHALGNRLVYAVMSAPRPSWRDDGGARLTTSIFPSTRNAISTPR